MKKLIRSSDSFVRDALNGFAAAHAGLVRVEADPDVVVRADAPVAGKVGLVSGGGSGHEPLHAGFVGYGMLDAAVPGPVFTSPTPDPIVAATRAVDGGAGVLHIVKNYTGDVLNFEVAADLVAADGVPIESVLVDDDVAVQDSLYTAGRRGVAGTVLVEKIAGAAAERGDDLAAVARVARKVVEQVATMGVALAAPIVPHSGRPSFDLGDDEVEIGIGIHGEPGRARIPFDGVDGVVARLLDPVLEDLTITSEDDVLLFVNGMGATPEAELYVVYDAAASMLRERNVTVSRSLVGSYVTSLDMQGCSITVLRLDDELKALWDAPVETAALRWGR